MTRLPRRWHGIERGVVAIETGVRKLVTLSSSST